MPSKIFHEMDYNRNGKVSIGNLSKFTQTMEFQKALEQKRPYSFGNTTLYLGHSGQT